MEQLGEAKMAVDAQIQNFRSPHLRARHPRSCVAYVFHWLSFDRDIFRRFKGGIQLLWLPLSTKNTERFTASVAALFSQFSKRDAQLRQQKVNSDKFDTNRDRRMHTETGREVRSRFGSSSLGNFCGCPLVAHVVYEKVRRQMCSMRFCGHLSEDIQNISSWFRSHNPNLTCVTRDGTARYIFLGRGGTIQSMCFIMF